MTYRHASRGLSMIELLVAMALGALVLAGALGLAATATTSLRARDAAADMQERARLALANIEYDLQHAGYYGLTAQGGNFGFLQGGDVAAAAPPTSLRQTAPAIAGLAASAHGCGENFAIDLAVPVQADNDRFELGRNRTATCAARGGARPAADTLTIRRASADTSAPDAGRVQLLVDAVDPSRRWLLSDAVLPGGALLQPDTLQLHDLETTIYYVSNRSDGDATLPSLRRKSLTRVAGNATFVDTEVIGGVEDLQLQLHTARGVHAPDAVPPGMRVLAITVWLRVRSALAEAGHVDNTTYVYAGHSATPATAEQRFRRVLVSRTVAIRNARAL